MRNGSGTFSCVVPAHIPIELEVLYQRSRTQVTDEDKILGVTLLTAVYFQLLDTTFVNILDALGKGVSPSKELADAHRTINDVKEKAQHYLLWIVKFIANKRFVPVIAHFYTLLQQNDEGQPSVVFPLSNDLTADIKRVVADLAESRAENFDQGSELIIRVVEASMMPLAIVPKNLMKFNFMVDKTLSGIISLSQILIKRMLNKLSPKIETQSYPQIATHLQTFLKV
jgi:hypothetical protein